VTVGPLPLGPAGPGCRASLEGLGGSRSAPVDGLHRQASSQASAYWVRPAAHRRPSEAIATAESDPGCVKTRRGITAPRILRLVVILRAKKHKNSSSAQHYDQIGFRFHTAYPYRTQRPFGLRTRARAAGPAGLPANDAATSRAHARKRSTTGLRVRFFSVTIATEMAFALKSTGSTVRA